VAAEYGSGTPMPLLKKWIDKIEFLAAKLLVGEQFAIDVSLVESRFCFH
jgi:hypothetical protein